jgi:hypothetical protein
MEWPFIFGARLRVDLLVAGRSEKKEKLVGLRCSRWPRGMLEFGANEPTLLHPFRASGAQTGLDAHRRH